MAHSRQDMLCGLTWMVCPAAVRTEMAALCMAGAGRGAIACTEQFQRLVRMDLRHRCNNTGKQNLSQLQRGIILNLPHNLQALLNLYACSWAIGNDSSLTPTAYLAFQSRKAGDQATRKYLPLHYHSMLQAVSDLSWKWFASQVLQCLGSEGHSLPEEV